MAIALRDKIIMVTGGGRGIGRATAERLAAAGATIGVAELDPATAEEAVAAIRASGGTAYALVGDVGDRATFMALAQRLSTAAGRIDGVVNAAMWIKYSPIGAVDTEIFDRMVSVGLKAPVWGTQAVLRHMDPARGGSVVNFSSPAADPGLSQHGDLCRGQGCHHRADPLARGRVGAVESAGERDHAGGHPDARRPRGGRRGRL